MASSTLGRWPLLGGRRFAHGAIPRPGVGHDGSVLARVVGDYLFGLDDAPAPAELGVSRIPDADGGFRWVLTWRTDVLVARDGTEQRISTLSNPRHRFEGSFLLDDADARTIRQLLNASPDGTYDLPLPHEAVAAIVEVSGGSIYISSTAAGLAEWITPGRRIYVIGPGAGDAYTTTITGSSGGTINVASSPPVGGWFPANNTLIFPCETVRFESDQTIARYPVNLARWGFRARAAARAQPGTGAPALTTFDGYTVLDRRPFQERTVDETSLGGVEFLDNGATMTSDTSWGRAKLRRLGSWRIDSPSDRQWWKAFLTERRGKWKPFLFPTWRPDLELYEQPTAGGAFVRVTTEYIDEWYPSLAHRRLQIEYADRSVTHHYVHSTSQGSGYQEITLVPTLANPIPTGGVTRVSFLETARLDTDEIAIEYGGGWKAKVSPPAIVVQESNVRSFAWPSTAAGLRAAFGFGTWASAWLCDDHAAPGTLADAFGGVTLSPASTPLYQQAGAIGATDLAVGFDTSSSDAFKASDTAAYNLTAATSIALFVCVKPTQYLNRNFFGKLVGANGYALSLESSPAGYMTGAVAAGSAAVVTVAAEHINEFRDVLLCIDRTNQRIQLFTSLGQSAAVDISAIGSPSNAGGLFLGAFTSMFAASIAYAAVATGDIPDLRTNGAAAIANIRRYTGRA